MAKPNMDGKHVFGIVKVGEKGQIVIPKEARDVFNIKPGSKLLVLGDEQYGIAMAPADDLTKIAPEILGALPRKDVD